MNELKPCPFCGGEAFEFAEEDDEVGALWHWYRCVNCCAEGGKCTDKTDAIAAWNRRA